MASRGLASPVPSVCQLPKPSFLTSRWLAQSFPRTEVYLCPSSIRWELVVGDPLGPVSSRYGSLPTYVSIFHVETALFAVSEPRTHPSDQEHRV